MKAIFLQNQKTLDPSRPGIPSPDRGEWSPTLSKAGAGTPAERAVPAVFSRRPQRAFAGLALLAALVCAGSTFAAEIIVNDLGDDATPGNGLCTLREAIHNANDDNTDTTGGDCEVGNSEDTITFGVEGTIYLGSTLPEITDGAGLKIDGGNGITVSGGGTMQVMLVSAGAVAELVGLTVADGFSDIDSDGGGGIENHGKLTVAHSTLSRNTAFAGGGIRNFGTLTVTHSTVSGNTAHGDGGGIENIGTLTVANSTVSGNSTDRDGGGIWNGRTLTVTHSTLYQNSAGSSGGGIFNDGSLISEVAILNLDNAIVGGSLSGGDCVNGTDAEVNPSGVNLIEDGSCGADSDPDHFITGNPNLAPLADNGGPTMTVALCQAADSPAGCTGNSPAIDAVPAAACSLATDQRGETRPVDGDGDGAALCDIGAYELQVPLPFEGFFAPVDNPPTVNLAKAGQGIPVKFSLGGDLGLDIFQQGYPKAVQIACDGGMPSDVVDETVAAGASGLQYDPDTDTYTYAWKTSKSWKGSCRKLSVKLIDGSEHSALFEFK